MEFAAGFVALHQGPDSLAIRTEINWAIVDQQRLANAEEIEDYENEGDKEYRDFIAKQKELEERSRSFYH